MPDFTRRARAAALACTATWCLWPIARSHAEDALQITGYPHLYQRVITLPGAAYGKEPQAATSTPVDTVFAIYYVYERRQIGQTTWYRVGATQNGDSLGWIPGDKLRDWNTMLVMNYPSQAHRDRVLFFDSEDHAKQMVSDAAADPTLVKRTLDAADHGDHPEGVVSVEPSSIADGKPFVMPVLQTRAAVDNRQQVKLVEIGSLNANPTDQPPPQPPPDDPATLRNARIAIVFVLDTTISMDPYIDRARAVVRGIYDTLDNAGALGQVSFGIVGYRNNMDREPQKSKLDYVSHIYQPLDPAAKPHDVLDALETVHQAKISTIGVDEDALAGFHDALYGMDWSPFVARFVIHVTDSGFISGHRSLAHWKDENATTTRSKAVQDGIILHTFHLETEEAHRANDVERAQDQYRELTQQPAERQSNDTYGYHPIENGDPAILAAALDQVAHGIVIAAKKLAAGQKVEKLAENAGPKNLTTTIVNEIFNAQQHYLATTHGGDAPRFFDAWAADRDIADPKNAALLPAVFLTRNQINELAQSLRGILDRAKESSLKATDFFDLLQSLATQMSNDPHRRFNDVGQSGLLPNYLSYLQDTKLYKSRILNMTADEWRGLGILGQGEFIADTEYLLKVYADIEATTSGSVWQSLNSGGKPDDSALQVHALRLDLLP